MGPYGVPGSLSMGPYGYPYHSRIPYPAKNHFFFYRKTGNFHRKNDQEKISEIFVHVAPEKT